MKVTTKFIFYSETISQMAKGKYLLKKFIFFESIITERFTTYFGWKIIFDEFDYKFVSIYMRFRFRHDANSFNYTWYSYLNVIVFHRFYLLECRFNRNYLNLSYIRLTTVIFINDSKSEAVLLTEVITENSITRPKLYVI